MIAHRFSQTDLTQERGERERERKVKHTIRERVDVELASAIESRHQLEMCSLLLYLPSLETYSKENLFGRDLISPFFSRPTVGGFQKQDMWMMFFLSSSHDAQNGMRERNEHKKRMKKKKDAVRLFSTLFLFPFFFLARDMARFATTEGSTLSPGQKL